MENPAPPKPSSDTSAGPSKAAGGCLRGCLVGCGAVLGLAFVISMAVVVWFAIPYPDRAFEGWFRPDHTVAGRLRLDLRDQETWALLETGLRNAAEKKHQNVPSPLRELAVERDVSKAENLRALGGIEMWGFSQGTTETEQPLMVLPVRGYGKVAQTLYGLVTLPVPASTVRNHKGASIVVLDPEGRKPRSWGLTTFRGYAMAGQVDPTLLDGVEHVVDGTPAPGGGFIPRTWPREQVSALTLVVDNRHGTIGRVIRDLAVFVETARRAAAEAASQVPVPAEDPEPAEIRVNWSAIRTLVEAQTPPEPVWDGFEGLVVEGSLPSNNAIEVVTTWTSGPETDPAAFPALMRDLATRLSTATGLTVVCRVVADHPTGLRAAFSFSGVKEMVDSLGSTTAPDRQVEDGDGD